MRWTESVASVAEVTNAYKILVGKSERKEPLERPTLLWEDKFETDLKKKRVHKC
jgi:hypothetical protein